jgi:hypothetical protein
MFVAPALMVVAAFFSFFGAVATAQERSQVQEPPDFGKFYGSLQVRLQADGTELTVLEDVAYQDPDGVFWVLPAGARACPQLRRMMAETS